MIARTKFVNEKEKFKQQMKILIKNGKIITFKNVFVSDILCENGKISKINNNISTQDTDEVIDATGKLIFPGGIDPHVHMHLPSPAGYSSDDFYSGSVAALFGGTTTLIDFVTPDKEQSLPSALEKRKKEAMESLIDYSFHVSPVEWRKKINEEIQQCIHQGVNSFKMYMAYKNSIGLEDNEIFEIMKIIGKYGGIVTLHCELGDEIEEMRNTFANENKLSPIYHTLSRPPETEALAVKKAIKLAKKANCPLYIVHVSSRKSLKYIRKAQDRNQMVFAETCPQYLLLDDSKYTGDFYQVAPYIMSPPLRTYKDNKALWNALDKSIISTVGTDHCPFMMKQKENGINDFRKIPNGAGGVEHRMALLYTYGVLAKKISLRQFVNITSTNAAKIFGLYPAKGEIAKGSDADLIIWNPDKENVISAHIHHQNCDNNIYEGIKVKGEAQYVIQNGKIAISNGKLVKKDTGKYLKRQLSN